MPSEVHVCWAGLYGVFEVVGVEKRHSLCVGNKVQVSEWLKQHSYVCTWSLAGGEPIGHYVRKEAIPC